MPSAQETADDGLAAIASYEAYEDAQRPVEALSEGGFPVDRLGIVGRDMRLVERVTGRRTLGRATLDSVITGAVLGASLGWFLGLFGWVDPLVSGLVLAAYGAVTGAVVGAVVGLAIHAGLRNRRDFESESSMQARRDESCRRSSPTTPAPSSATPRGGLAGRRLRTGGRG